LNKFRPSQGNDDLSVPGVDVTNTSFMERLRCWLKRPRNVIRTKEKKRTLT